MPAPVADVEPVHRSLTLALVRSILEQPDGRPWRLSAIGLLGLRLDPAGEHRLHLWDPTVRSDEDPIHDHPFDFTSTVIAGELVNTLYVEDPAGVEHERVRYEPEDEAARRTDAVRLVGRSTRHRAGDSYHQLAHELHGGTQVPGTVTVLRRTFVDAPTLTVCRPPGRPWVSGRARSPEPAELHRFTTAALALLG